MHKHIFTLGLILTSVYTTTAMAWPTKEATDVWTNSGHTTPATMRCEDCCKTSCWLPSGTTYYDNKGTFTTSCTGEPSEPTCDPNKYYSVVSGVCTGSCTNNTYDIGLDICIDPYWSSGISSEPNESSKQWDARFEERDHGIVFTLIGLARCYSFSDGEYSLCSGGRCNDIERTSIYDTSGGECWCRVKEIESDSKDISLSNQPSWIYLTTFEHGTGWESCYNNCTSACSDAFMYEPEFRDTVYHVLSDYK